MLITAESRSLTVRRARKGEGSAEGVRRASARLGLTCAIALMLLLGVVGCGLLPGGEQDSDGISSAVPEKGPTLATMAGTFFGSGLVPQERGSFGLEDRTRIIRSDDSRFPKVLRVYFPANSASNRSAEGDGTTAGGAQLYLKLADGAADRLYLRYYVRFPEGFDFVKGGKLPGLYGGTVTSGLRIPDGTDGFSTRYMWRRDGDAEIYAYLPTSEEHGTSLGRGSWTWKTGKWTCVEQEVRLNTPGQSDGSVTVWLDGEEEQRVDSLTFRTVDSLHIEGIFFSTFFGGGDSSWASPKNQYADFAAFAISDRRIGPLGSRSASAVP